MEFYEIGEKIKESRKEKNLSQTALADRVGITRQTLSKLENGEIGKISLQVFVKVLEALDQELSVDDKKPFYYFDPKSIS